MYEKLWNDLKASVEPELVRTMEAMEELAKQPIEKPADIDESGVG